MRSGQSRSINSRFMKIGSAGSFLGHVMLVTEQPRSIGRDTLEAHWFSPLWPLGGITELWRVRAMESTRKERGLYEAEMIFFVEKSTGRFLLVGELNDRLELGVIKEPEVLEFLRSPPQLRRLLRPDVVGQVLDDMRQEMGEMNWSMATAVRAALKSAAIPGGGDPLQVIEEIRACWRREPICTSVIVTFWQRYLLKLAEVTIDDYGEYDTLKVVDAILKQMPLKSDRTLPGELLAAMAAAGWLVVKKAA